MIYFWSKGDYFHREA